MINFTPRPLYLRGNSSHSLDRSLGDTKSRSSCYGEDRNFLPLPGIEFRLLDRPSRSPVGIPNGLMSIVYGPTYLGSMFYMLITRKMTNVCGFSF